MLTWGAARKVVQNDDMESYNTVKKLYELLKSTFSDKHDLQNILMNIKQQPEEKMKSFSVRLRVDARKCGFHGKILINMSFNYVKKCAQTHIFALLDNFLPSTSFEVALEHAIKYERKKEAEGEKKNTKRKSEAIDQIDEEDEDQTNSKLKKQELKNDFGKTFQ